MAEDRALAYRDQFAALLPRGLAWLRAPGSNMIAALYGMSEEFARIDGRYYKRIDATAPIPALLVPIACAIIYYRLWKNSSPTDQVKADYDDAIARLKDIATGKITLDQGEEKLPERDGQILVESSERLFTRNALRGA